MTYVHNKKNAFIILDSSIMMYNIKSNVYTIEKYLNRYHDIIIKTSMPI